MIFDTLDNLELYLPLLPQLKKVIEVMDRGEVYAMECGLYTTQDEKVRYRILSYMTSDAKKQYEIHKNAVDVQIVLEGEELMSLSWRESIKDASPQDGEDDTLLVEGEPLSVVHASVGRFVVFFPGEPHKCAVAVANAQRCKKVVFKLT